MRTGATFLSAIIHAGVIAGGLFVFQSEPSDVDASTMIVIPLELGAQANRVVRVDAATGDERALTNPTTTPLRILGGDWALAPDGRRIAFVSRDDRNIWLIELPVE